MKADGLQLKSSRREEKDLVVEEDDDEEKEEEVTQNLSLAERTSGVIEPLPKLQWFVLVNQEFPMGENELGIDAGTKVTLKSLMRHVVESGQIEIFPDNYKKIYYHWIDNLRDWCISRQIWFGHRVPVWYDKDGGQHLPEEKQVYLARHAECEDNAQNILARPESRLTEKGKEQAKQLAEELREKHITKIITSTLNRAQETARLVAEYLGLAEGDIEIWPEVDEIHVGNLIGKAEDLRLHGFAQAQKEGTGESLESIEKRALSAITKLENLRTNGEILVVAHGGFNAVFEAALQGRKKEDYVAYRTKRGNIPNASWAKLTIIQDPIGEDLLQDEDTLDTWYF
jgi:valyl-tRNA synthetase